MLRALGLLVELMLPASIIHTIPAQGVVQVRWPGAPASPALPEIVSPWTQYEFEGSRFLPASTANISAGMVTLNDDRHGTGPLPSGDASWEVVTVDVDGGTRRLREAARALLGPNGSNASPEAGLPPASEIQPATLPALRTAGLLLVRRGRQNDFAARREAADTNARRDSMSAAVLTADDLVLGYRIDIQEGIGGTWFSLHQRDAVYRVAGTIIGAERTTEEGQVKVHAAVRQGDGPLHADEVVARWSGWSLAVPQPTLGTQTGRAGPERRASLPFEFEFSLRKGSLPRLQFTKTYLMRARVADIAGGGLALDDPAANRCATQPVVYRRYEPVASPAVVLPDGLAPETLGPGESDDLVVIRSDAGINVDEFAKQNPRYTSTTTRALLPPLVSLALAEQHPGVLDGEVDGTWELMKRALALLAKISTPVAGDIALPDPAAGGVTAFPQREPGGVSAELAARQWTEAWPELNPKQLELREPQAGGSPLEWQDNRLVARLDRAEQLTLELSTFLRSGDFLDHFATRDLMPQESETTALLGRHPLLTPARVVTLVHAVRRPMSDPQGNLQPQRKPGETFALLAPQPSLLNIHPGSTVKLDVSASWSERHDDTTSEIVGSPVQSVIIGRGDGALKDRLQQEFGDTRHRRISYTLTAVSRFRRFFHEDEGADAFLARTTLQPVSVPSSARPTPPIVLSTLPSFRWEQDGEDRAGSSGMIVRRRLSGLRIELQRPWFQSGEGEMLAVVVAQDNEPPAQLRPFLTQAGGDPIWDTPRPRHWLTGQAFTSGAGEITAVALEEARTPVMVVPHVVWFHEGRWYADITLPELAASSYCPFVQLAVARYQPESLPGLELSAVVLTEMVPLLPARTLTMSTSSVSAGMLEATLEGVGASGPRPNRVDLIVEQCVLPPGMKASAVNLSALAPTSDAIPAWVVHASTSGSLGSSLAVALPSTGAGPLRIRVREVELIGSGGEVAAQVGTAAELTERTVFTDLITGSFLE